MARAEFEYSSGFQGYKSGAMLNETRDALLSYEIIQQKTQYWGNRVEKLLLNDYSEKIFIMAPLITGRLEISALDLNFYVDTRQERGGVRYSYNF